LRILLDTKPLFSYAFGKIPEYTLKKYLKLTDISNKFLKHDARNQWALYGNRLIKTPKAKKPWKR